MGASQRSISRREGPWPCPTAQVGARKAPVPIVKGGAQESEMAISSEVASTDLAGTKVGRVRFTIVAMLFVITVINYADRATMSVAKPDLSKEFGLNAAQMGWILSAFGWAYVICQIPGGWLLDRFGSKIVYFGSIFLWSLFTLFQGSVAVVGAAAAVYALFVLRLPVGLRAAPHVP